MSEISAPADEAAIDDLTIEELGEVGGAGTLGTGSTLSTPASSAATFGSH